MRRVAWILLLLFAFAIPWEYSLDLSEPLGNIARILGMLTLLAAIPAVLQSGRLRAPGPMQWLVLALFLWFCCTYFWTIEPLATLFKLRGFVQEFMIVWLLWEFAESASDLRALLRAAVAGSWVLALLTMVNFASASAMAAEQVRFAASGQDPNDVARYLNLSFPLAALLVNSERRWPWRWLAAGYLPLGLVAVLLTASRGGFLAAVVGFAGSLVLLVQGHPRRVLAWAMALPPLAAILWFIIPRGSFERLSTIAEQLHGGGLNQRWNIWNAGWHAFGKAPLFGTGAGTFVSAAGTASMDTAHNTVLSIAVTGGLCALFLATAIVAVAVWSITQMRGPLQGALALALVVWFITSMVATVEENRTTWLLLGLIALAGRLADEEPEELAACFPAAAPSSGKGSVP
ncbi:MAG: O-antigen ligase family protein [Terracidiphilus sp.]|jgi:O-antigen ligase